MGGKKKLAWAFRSTGAQPTPVVSLLWTILDESFDAHDTVHREMEGLGLTSGQSANHGSRMPPTQSGRENLESMVPSVMALESHPRPHEISYKGISRIRHKHAEKRRA